MSPAFAPMYRGAIDKVIFDEDKHTYEYEGKTLSGVTGAIGRYMGKSFPDTQSVRLALSYGSQVHKECERYLNEGIAPVSASAVWVRDELKRFYDKEKGIACQGEVRVSDFTSTASSVDVVMHTEKGALLFDIKTGFFDREYCTYQLSAYAYLFSLCYTETVAGLYVLNTKRQRTFRIRECSRDKIMEILSLNR